MAALLDMPGATTARRRKPARPWCGIAAARRHTADAGIFLYPNKQLIRRSGMVVTETPKSHNAPALATMAVQIGPGAPDCTGTADPCRACRIGYKLPPSETTVCAGSGQRARIDAILSRRKHTGAIAICCATTHTCCSRHRCSRQRLAGSLRVASRRFSCPIAIGS